MKKTVFDPNHQQEDVSSKIIVGLERISQAFKVQLWEKAKTLGLSPIQIQLLIFVHYHKNDLNTVSLLAQEFNVTKPTISDAVKVMEKKGLIKKSFDHGDQRTYFISPTDMGRDVVLQTEDFAAPLYAAVQGLGQDERNSFYGTLRKLIVQLNKKGVLTVQRTCSLCRFYQKAENKHYCGLLDTALQPEQLRLDCPEFEEK